jgi:hypothetical protein
MGMTGMRIRIAFALFVLFGLMHQPVSAAPNLDSGTLLTLSSASAGQYVSAEQGNPESSTLKCVVNLTSVSAAQVVVQVQGRDRGSGSYINIFSTPALPGAGTWPITVGPAMAPTLATGPYVVSDVLPVEWRVVANVLGSSASSVTGTVGCSMVD